MDKTFTQILKDFELSCNNSHEEDFEFEPSQNSLNLIRQFAKVYKVCKPDVPGLPLLSVVLN